MLNSQGIEVDTVIFNSCLNRQGTYCGRNIKPCTGQFKAKVSCDDTTAQV